MRISQFPQRNVPTDFGVVMNLDAEIGDAVSPFQGGAVSRRVSPR
jgi:hypothetical protein